MESHRASLTDATFNVKSRMRTAVSPSLRNMARECRTPDFLQSHPPRGFPKADDENHVWTACNGSNRRAAFTKIQNTFLDARVDDTPSPAAYYPQVTLTKKRPRTVPCGRRVRRVKPTDNPGPADHTPSYLFSRKNNQFTAASFAQYNGREPATTGHAEHPSPSKYDVSTPHQARSDSPSAPSAAFGNSRSARLPYQLVEGTEHSTMVAGCNAILQQPSLVQTKRKAGQALFAMMCRQGPAQWDLRVSPGPAAYMPSHRAVKPHIWGGSFLHSVRMPSKRLAHSDVTLEPQHGTVGTRPSSRGTA